MNSDYIFLTFIILIGIFILFGDKILFKLFSKKVFEHSCRIQKLLKLNKQYNFRTGFWDGEYYSKLLPNKRAFDKFKLDNLMRKAIEEKQEYYKNIIDNIEYNRELYDNYLRDINELELKDAEMVGAASEIGIPLNLYQSIENRLFDEWEIKAGVGNKDCM